MSLRYGLSYVQNLRRGHYEPATAVSPQLRLPTAFSELALAMVTSSSARPEACHSTLDATGPSPLRRLSG